MNDAGSITDVPGIRIGHWTDRRAITGCTVVLPDRPCVAGVDVRGGAPGTRETDLLRPGNLVQEVHAVCLAGGSAFGLEAASGVMKFLAERGVGYPYRRGVVPIVPSAILFDLGIGRADRWPGVDEGYRACANAKRSCAEGSVGAGTGATAGTSLGPERAVKGGIGTASERTAGGLIAGAIAAVNPMGDVIDDQGRAIAGPRRDNGSFDDTVAVLREGRMWQPPARDEHNTALVVVATNAILTKEQANRLATVCHDGMARAVRPCHTPSDGDTIFALATGELPIEHRDYRALEVIASLAVERAIRRGVTRATGLGGVPAIGELVRATRRRSARRS